LSCEQSVSVTILATSDIHSCVYPTDYRDGSEHHKGLAKLAAIIRRERETDPQLLLIDNGDLIQGTPLASYYALHQQKIHPAIRILNHLRYDAAVIGNHEFNYGQDLLMQAVEDSNFPWLAVNITDAVTGKPAFGPPYLLRRIKDITIAIVGMTTHYIPQWEQAEHIAGLKFEDSLEALQRWVHHIRITENPDIIIAAYHGGFECDLDTGESHEAPTGENQGYAMLTTIPDIDVLITGHQHRLLAGEWNGTAVIQPGSFGQAIGKIRLDLRRSNMGWMLEGKHVELLHADCGAEADIVALCYADELLTQTWLDQPLGTTEGDMRIRDPFQARLAEHPFIELLNRVQMDAAGVDISCTALMHNEAPGFSAQITMREVMANYPYANTLKVLRLSGEDIRHALERSAAYFALDAAGRPTIARTFLTPKPQHYNYDMWEGIEYELELCRPVGQRVTKLQKDGATLLADATYDVVMNHYRASGGGGFDFFRGKPVIREIQSDMTELIAAYISKHSVIRSTCNHNWRVCISEHI